MISTILLKDGTVVRKQIKICIGACMIDDPTAYITINGQTIWVKPGESVGWVQA